VKVILYHPKTDHEKFYQYYWVPYSLLTIASGCVERGIDVVLIDANAKDNEEVIRDLDKIKQEIVCVGISCMTGKQIKNGLEFAKKIRKLNSQIPLIWGGPHPTLYPVQTLENEYVDFVIQGQGERRLPELVESICMKKEQPFHIEGVGEKIQDKIFVDGRHELQDKSTFPKFPWDKIDLKHYIKDDRDINTRTLNYVSSQGCPFQCGFCSEVALYGSKWTSFSAERVIEDIDYLIKNTGINGVKFYDANFFASIKRSMSIAEKLCKYKIKWAASGHPATLLSFNDEQWKLLKKSGCNRILIGLESGSQAVLDSIHKGYKVDRALELANKLKEYDIVGSFTFIVGFPDQVDDDEVRKTIELARKIRKVSLIHECKIHFYAPYPGTPLWNKAVERGFEVPSSLEEWSDFDYYCIETPWIDKNLEEEIHIFNRENCPYVHL